MEYTKKDTRMCESVFEEENKNEKVNVIRILVSDLWKWVEMSRNVTKSQTHLHSKRFSEFIISRAKN